MPAPDASCDAPRQRQRDPVQGQTSQPSARHGTSLLARSRRCRYPMHSRRQGILSRDQSWKAAVLPPQCVSATTHTVAVGLGRIALRPPPDAVPATCLFEARPIARVQRRALNEELRNRCCALAKVHDCFPREMHTRSSDGPGPTRFSGVEPPVSNARHSTPPMQRPDPPAQRACACVLHAELCWLSRRCGRDQLGF